MAFVWINDNGYEYCGKKNHIIFSADKTHTELFDYVASDLSYLPILLEQYVFKKIDTTTFELKESYDNIRSLDTIKEILISAHPYYEHQYREVLINAIGNYFNSLLIYSIFRSKNLTFSCVLEREWYNKRIYSLILPLLHPGDTYLEDFYYNLEKIINPKEYLIDDFFITDVPKSLPNGFTDEIETQTSIANMLYLILDISAANMKDLTISQRIWLYGNIFYGVYNTPSEMGIKQQLSFLPPSHYQYEPENILKSENSSNIDKTFKALYDIRIINIGRDGVPANIMEYFNTAIEYAKLITTATVYEKYEVSSLRQLLYLETLSMIQSNTMIRKCKNCGKYFVVSNRKIAYCNRTDESGFCCSTVGSKRSFQQKMETDEALKIYNRAYKTHFARCKKKKMTQNDFSDWCEKAKENLAKARAGSLDISTFEEWLKK